MPGMGRPSASTRPAPAAPAPVPARPGSVLLPSAASGVGRSLRLPAFVAVSGLLGVGAHAAVEHGVPDPSLALVAVLAVTGVSLLLRGRERSFEAIGLTLVVGQAVVHAVLCLSHCAQTSPAGALVHAVMTPGGAAHSRMGAPGYLAHLYPGHTMLVAHLLAAGVAAWWLRQGEAAVWAAVGWAWPALNALPVAVPVDVEPLPRPRHDTAVRTLRDQVEDLRAHPRRGPPARVRTSRAPVLA